MAFICARCRRNKGSEPWPVCSLGGVNLTIYRDLAHFDISYCFQHHLAALSKKIQAKPTAISTRYAAVDSFLGTEQNFAHLEAILLRLPALQQQQSATTMTMCSWRGDMSTRFSDRTEIPRTTLGMTPFNTGLGVTYI